MEKLQGKYPQIRFPEFKDVWDHRKLSELLSESKKRNEELKFTKDDVLSVSGELGIVNQIEHLGRSYAGVSVHNYHVVDTGDIVYTKSPLKANPFGIIKLNKGQAGIVSTLYAVYKVNPQNACGEFIDNYFSLDANTNRYLRPLVKKGAKNDMKINNAYVLHDRIYAPSKEEQKRIASFFAVLEKKIAELKQKKSLLELYKRSIVHKIFSQELRFKDSGNKPFQTWEKKTMHQVGETYNGLTGKTKEDFGSGKPYIQYKQIFDDTKINIERFDFVEVSPSEHQNKAKYGDVFFTTSSETPLEVGYSSVLLDHIDDLYLNSFCFGFRIKSFKQLNPEFAQYLFRSPNFRKEVIKLGQGSTRYNMSKGEFMKIEIQLPSENEQKIISKFLQAIDDKIHKTKLQIQQTEQYKNGLLQKMFC